MIPLPETGIHWLAGEELTGACEHVSANQWHRMWSNARTVWVAADGPSGSGRYWTITVGLSDELASQPMKGLCLNTSTLGWRTLQQYDRTPLPWIADLDEDGQAEFLLWSSFLLSDEPIMSQYGLVVWVYELKENDKFILDWNLTEKMALELAEAYRQPLYNPGFELSRLRKTAVNQLNALASGACRNTPVEIHK